MPLEYNPPEEGVVHGAGETEVKPHCAPITE